jgi:Putative DnaT-like ssDNA binding protein
MSFSYPTVVINSVSYPVYQDVAGADTYFGTVPASTWPGTGTYSATQKAQGLLQATRLIDKQKYAGAKTDVTNALAFPRTGLTDVDGNAVDSATLPAAVQIACCELALAILVDPSVLSNAQGTSQATKRLKAGSAEVEYFNPIAGTRLPTIVSDWLMPFFGGGSTTAIGATGTDGCSSFDDCHTRDVWREP